LRFHPYPPPAFRLIASISSPPQTISISTLHKKNGDDDEKVLPSRRFRLDLTLTLTSHPAASQLASFPFYLYPSLVLSRLFGLFHPSFLLFAFFPFSPLMPLRMNDTSLSLSLSLSSVHSSCMVDISTRRGILGKAVRLLGGEENRGRGVYRIHKKRSSWVSDFR
jgi:hypothetical protein